MKKYEFVSLKLKNSPPGSAFLEGHRELINEYAKKGFEYKGYVPTHQGASGKAVEIDLIFEREE